jgi:hypothetical protein
MARHGSACSGGLQIKANVIGGTGVYTDFSSIILQQCCADHRSTPDYRRHLLPVLIEFDQSWHRQGRRTKSKASEDF